MKPLAKLCSHHFCRATRGLLNFVHEILWAQGRHLYEISRQATAWGFVVNRHIKATPAERKGSRELLCMYYYT